METLFVGVGGVVIGALLTAALTYGFQKKLLEQQLSFLRRQAELDAELRKQIHEEQVKVFGEFRNMVNTRFAHLPGLIRDELHGKEGR